MNKEAIIDIENPKDNDLISRQAVLDMMQMKMGGKELYMAIYKLPPVNPQPKTGYCKDCKWWKDSDGEYRRGCGAESPCPINRIEVLEGNGYCYMFEPQESEVQDEDIYS
jgi:hypothetical protein